MQIEQALDLYLTQLRADGMSVHTIRQAMRHVTMLADYVGPRDVGEITHADVAKFLASNQVARTIRGEPRKPTSTNALRSTIRSFLRYVHSSGLSSANAGALVRRAQVGNRPPRSLTAAEQHTLLCELDLGIGEAGRRDRALFGLLLATGMRIGSALAIEGEDVDLDAGVIRLKCVKGGGEQQVFLPPHIVDLIRPHVAPGLLFPISPRQAHRRLEEAGRRAGIKKRLSPHVLRHTFGQAVFDKTRDLLVTQAALGHRSIQSTTVYARASGARVRAAVGA